MGGGIYPIPGRSVATYSPGEMFAAPAKVLALYKDGSAVQELREGDLGVVVLDETPFYAESGGQVGDVGMISSGNAHLNVLDTLRPYIALAETLGSFVVQLYARELTEVRLEFAGAVTSFPSEPLTTAALKGLLTPMVGPEVNYINAPFLANERGIRIIETKSPRTEGYASLIRLTVKGTDGEHFVCGALFGEEDFRIVRVDGYNVEAVPKGHILVLHNEDRPGMVGFIGQVLGQAGVNIAMMNLTRQKINGKAISLVNIDSRIPEAQLEELRAHPGIVAVHQIEL